MAEEDLAASRIYFRYESIHVALDVRHRKSSDRIGAGKYLPHVRQVSPSSSLGDAIPGIQRLAKIGVFACRQEQLSAADDVQSTSDRFYRSSHYANSSNTNSSPHRRHFRFAFSDFCEGLSRLGAV